jgi:hypothetical protein
MIAVHAARSHANVVISVLASPTMHGGSIGRSLFALDADWC